jgi:DNA-binding transcriptional ArsR family regulator
MESEAAILTLSALAQPTRLEAFRLLVGYEPTGLPAGDLARLLAIPQNTLSAHLAILSRADLVTRERQSRSIIYRANLARLRDTTLYLLKDCCGGDSGLCAPIVASLTPCCPPSESQNA